MPLSASFRPHRTLLRASAALAAALAATAPAVAQDKPVPPKDAPSAPKTAPSAPKDAPSAPKVPMVPPKPVAPSGAAPEVTPVPNAPEPAALWAQFIDGCGGIDAIRAEGSRRTKGQILIPSAGLKGNVETYAKAPDRILVKTTMDQVGTMEQGFDGTHGWAVDMMSGPRLLDGNELDSFRRDASYDGPFGYLEKARSASTLGKATFADKECWVVELKETLGGDLTCYLDAGDGLLRGMRLVADTAMGKMPVEMVVVEYGTFGKVKMPSKSLTRVMMQEFTSTIDEITFEPIPDSMFEPPAAVKTLIEEKKKGGTGGAAPPKGAPAGGSAPPAKKDAPPVKKDAPPKP